MEIVLKSNVNRDKYTDYIQEHFDLAVSDVAEVRIPNNLNLSKLGSEWNIGVICGASGSGKSTILHSLGEITAVEFDHNKPLISNFEPMTPQEASSILCAMGLASVPTWIRPYSSLSNGERYRAEVAKRISFNRGGVILVDEYTSVVDRNVAKSMSNALQKYIRKEKKQIILATCHYDILEWLQPDWIYDLNKGGALEKGDCLRQRPQISLSVYRVTYDTWNIFKKHHYMTEEMNKSASCFVFSWGKQLVAFVGVLPQPSGYFDKAVRGTRTVVLPDFQGLGIGSRITDFIASIYKQAGYRYFTKTVNPKLGEYRNHSKKWKTTSKNGRIIRPSVSKLNKKQKLRASYCHEYVGDGLCGYEELIKPIEQMRYDKSMEGQLTLF